MSGDANNDEDGVRDSFTRAFGPGDPQGPAKLENERKEEQRNLDMIDAGMDPSCPLKRAVAQDPPAVSVSHKSTATAEARGESKEDKTLAASRKRRSGRGSSSILTGVLGVTGSPIKVRRPSLLGS